MDFTYQKKNREKNRETLLTFNLHSQCQTPFILTRFCSRKIPIFIFKFYKRPLATSGWFRLYVLVYFPLLRIICLPKKPKLTGLEKIAPNPSYSPWWTTVSLHATFQFTREEVLGPVDSKRWVTSPSQSNAEEPRKASEAPTVLAQKLVEKRKGSRGDWRVQAAHAARMQKAWFAWYNRALTAAAICFFAPKKVLKNILGCTLSKAARGRAERAKRL